MMEKLQLNDLMRSQYVKRWHIVNTSKSQSLAEHQYNVAIIGATIAAKMRLTGVVIKEVVMVALTHDIHEIVMGDVPSPAKRRGSKEGVFEFKLPFNYYVDRNTRSTVDAIVKAADFLDAIHFVDENGMGRHARAAAADIRHAYDKWKAEQDERLQGVLKDVEEELFSRGFVI
jgi:5'-deoxynucleotidase YfbR-like HD superfamily hydrolase